jgi:hypothetical protein
MTASALEALSSLDGKTVSLGPSRESDSVISDPVLFDRGEPEDEIYRTRAQYDTAQHNKDSA